MCKGGWRPSKPLRVARLRRACDVEAIGSQDKFPGASPSPCHAGPQNEWTLEFKTYSRRVIVSVPYYTVFLLLLTLRAQLLRANHPSMDNLALSCLILLDEATSGGVMKEIASSSKTKSKIKLKERHAFDAQAFLDSPGMSRKVVEYRKSENIYSQGDPATSVMYIQKGGVRLSVVNEVGKEAVLAILGPGDFFGEGGMAGQSVRMA